MMKLNWKKIVAGTMSGFMALSAIVTTGAVQHVNAQETLIVSAAGVADYVKENIADFEKAHNVKVEVLDADMFEKLDGLALDGPAGTAADVLIATYDRIGSLSNAHLAEVTLLEDAQYDDTDKRQVTVDGKVYGAPAVIETLVMFYNKDFLPEAPKTFEELEELSKDDKYKFSGEEGKNTAFLTKWTDFYFAYGLYAGFGGYVFGENGTNPSDIGLNNAGSIEAITYATDWYKNVWPKGMLDTKSSGDFISQSFIEGKTAAIITGPWEAAAFKDANVNFGVAKIPALPGGKEYKPFGGGKGWVISNYSTKKELAQKFIDWVSSEEQQTKLYEKRGEVPANQVARKKAAEGDSELTKAVIEVYANAVPTPNIPEMSEVWTGAENLMFDAASGTKSPEESANAAVELIKQNIEQKHGN